MDKKLFRSLLLLITFTVLLIFVIVKFDAIWDIFARVIGIFTPLFIGFAFAFILGRPCAFFKRLFDRAGAARLSVPLAVVCAYLSLFAAIALVVSFVIPQLAASFSLFASNLGGYIATAQAWVAELAQKLNLEDLANLNIANLDTLVKNMINGALSAVTNVAGQVFNFTSSLISVLITTVLSFVFSIYMLAGKDKLLSQCRRLMRAYLPQRFCNQALEVTRLTADTFTRFISGQLIEAVILGVLCCVGMLILRLDYAPLVGMLIGVSALIPIVGAFLGGTLGALLLAMVDPIKAVIFLVFLVCLQQFEGNVIYPRIVGGSLGLPGIWVLGAVTVGGGLFGFLGMLLSVPVASILFTLLRADVHARLGEAEEP